MNSIHVSSTTRNDLAPASNIVARYESYKYGWDVFSAGEPVTVCTTSEQRNGWWSALNAAADSDTYSFLVGGKR